GGPVADAPAPPAASATREVDPSDAAAAGTDTGSAKPNGDGPATAKPAMEKPADSTAASKTPAPPVESEEPSEPFVAPALADLEARANWIDNPVEDLLAVRRKAEAGQPTPLPAADAVALKNTTRETNAQILGTLGRVAQSNDEIDYEAVLNRHIKADVKSTNPVLSSSVYETDVHALITAGTLTFDRDLR
ncbi:MAG: hypothetical protein ACKOJF_27520, partial [Planctomycetaceae bacterium]